MPDNYDQDWTPDEAFWDEAWADMDRQLERQRRRPAMWLWLLLPLILLIGVMYTEAFNEDLAPASPPVEDFAVEEAEKPIATSKPAQEQLAPSNNITTAAEPKSPTSSQNRKTAAASIDTDSPTPTLRNTPPQVPETQPEQAEESKDEPTEADELVVRLVPELPTLSPGRIDSEDSLLVTPSSPEAVTPSFSQTAERRFYVTAGGNAYPFPILPGAFAELEYRLPAGKWFVPLALRIDRGRRSINTARSSDELSVALEMGSADPNTLDPNQPQMDLANQEERARAIRQQLSQSGNDQVNFLSLELRSGVGLNLGRRLSLSGGAGISYLLSGRGPAVFPDGNGVNLNSAFTVLLDELTIGNSNYQFSSIQAGSGSALPISANRWGLNTWMAADYEISRRFGLNVGLTRQLSNFYSDNVIRLNRTRVETGVWLRF